MSGDHGAKVLPRGQGFNPFTTGPSASIIRKSEPSVLPATKINSPVNNDNNATKPSQSNNDDDPLIKFAKLEAQRESIRSRSEGPKDISGELAIATDKHSENATTLAQRGTELSKAGGDVSSRISMQESSIAACEQELKAAKQACNMPLIKIHEAMLASKKRILAELKALQSEAQSKLPLAKSNQAESRSNLEGVKQEGTKINELNKDGSGLNIDEYIQNLLSSSSTTSTNTPEKQIRQG